MDEVIALLQQEEQLLQALEQLLTAEKKSLTGASAGREATKYAGEIDVTLRKFRKVRAAELALCAKRQVSDLRTAIENEPDQAKAREARRLSEHVHRRLQAVRTQGMHNRALLERIMLYTEFTVNVMRRARADGTYAREAAEASGMKPTVEERKLFDTDI